MSHFYDEIKAGQGMTVTTETIALKLGSFVSFLVGQNKDCGHVVEGSLFYHPNPPQISLADYCERLVGNLHVSLESYVMAASYIANLEDIVSELTAHRIMLTAVVVAVKNQDDKRPRLSYLSNVGGVEKAELVAMEKEFVQRLDYRTFVNPQTYKKALSAMATAHEFQKLLECASQPKNELVIDNIVPDSPIEELFDGPNAPPTPRAWSKAFGGSVSSVTSSTSSNSTSSIVSLGKLSSLFTLRRFKKRTPSSPARPQTVAPYVVWSQ